LQIIFRLIFVATFGHFASLDEQVLPFSSSLTCKGRVASFTGRLQFFSGLAESVTVLVMTSMNAYC
jgi:hypothetical protein